MTKSERKSRKDSKRRAERQTPYPLSQVNPSETMVAPNSVNPEHPIVAPSASWPQTPPANSDASSTSEDYSIKRARNNEAVRKCREKKRERELREKNEMEDLVKRNKVLKDQLSKMIKELEMLKETRDNELRKLYQKGRRSGNGDQ